MENEHQHKAVVRVRMRIAVTLTAVFAVVVVAGVARAQTETVNANQNLNINTNTNVDTNTNGNTVVLTPSAEEPTDPDIIRLNQQINEKQQQIEEMKRQTAIYEQQLQQKQDQRATLQTELSDLSDSIENTENEMEINTAQVESMQLQIEKVGREIETKQNEIDAERGTLATLLRRLYETDRVSNLELLVQEQTFSAYFSRIQNLHALSGSVGDTLNKVLDVKRQLDASMAELNTKRTELDGIRTKLEENQQLLGQQQTYKQNLLTVTQDSESKFQLVLQELQSESQNADSEIRNLIKQVNDRLIARGDAVVLEKPSELSWPIDTSRGISAYFHDPTYPFRKIMEHSAVDIRAYHGTNVTSAADGVVAVARKLDWIRDSKGRVLYPAYNYITIVHGGNLATVYGHLSVVGVVEGQVVKRGEIIGRSGATPGTAGAGRLTTGPHLHFEVRLNGIPQDPMQYLSTLQGSEPLP